MGEVRRGCDQGLIGCVTRKTLRSGLVSCSEEIWSSTEGERTDFCVENSKVFVTR